MSNPNAVPTRYLPRAHPFSWLILVVTTGSIVITSIDRTILPTVLPAILKEFRLSPSEGGVLIGLSYIGIAIGALVLGTLGDSLGTGPRRARTWFLTALVVAVAAIGTAVSYSIFALRSLRVLMGIGTGGMEPVSTAMAGDWWQKEDRGVAIGIHHTGFPIGQFAGPALVGLILAFASWRTSFLLLPLLGIPLAILQLIISRRKYFTRVERWIREQGLTPTLEPEEEGNPTDTGAIASLKVAFSSRNVRLIAIMDFLFLFSDTGIGSFLTLQLTRDVGLGLAAAATISGASGLTAWVGQIMWGRISDYIGRKTVLAILAVCLALAAASLTLIQSAAVAWILLLTWGLVRNSPYPVMYAALIDSVPRAASTGMGILIAVGLGLSGIIVGPVAGSVIENFGFAGSYLMMAAAYLLTLVPILMMRENSDTQTT